MSPALPRLELAVTRSLQDVPKLPRDAAAVALARRYARVIDDAQRVAEELDGMTPDTDAQAEAIRRLAAKVEAHSVVSDIGPKLLAALNSLGMTPQARSSTQKGDRPNAQSPAAAALAALRSGHTATR